MEIDEGVQWAVRYVTSMAERAGEDIETETRVEYMRGGKPVTFGYIDAYYGGHLFDLKTGMERDYVMQMCVYAAAMCQRDDLDSINVYLLYSKTRAVSHMKVSRESAEEIVEEVINKVEDPDKKPALCDYCNWCEHKRVCHVKNPDRILRAFNIACKKNLDAIEKQFAKSMRMKDKKQADALLQDVISNLTIET